MKDEILLKINNEIYKVDNSDYADIKVTFQNGAIVNVTNTSKLKRADLLKK